MGYPTSYPTQYSLLETFSETTAENINKICQHLGGDFDGDPGSKDLTVEMPATIGITPGSVTRFEMYQGSTQLTSAYFLANGSITSDKTFTIHDGDCIINNVFIELVENTTLDLNDSDASIYIDKVLTTVPWPNPTGTNYVYVCVHYDYSLASDSNAYYKLFVLPATYNPLTMVILNILEVTVAAGQVTSIDDILDEYGAIERTYTRRPEYCALADGGWVGDPGPAYILLS